MAKWEALARASYVVEWWDEHLGGHARTRWTFCGECGQRTGQTKPNSWGGVYTVLDTRAEVNHVEPRVGAGYDKGCWNHQTNLQVLCHACHVKETTRQLRERKPIVVVEVEVLPEVDQLALAL